MGLCAGAYTSAKVTSTLHDTSSRIGHARHPELARYLDAHAILRGSFKLASGRTSSYYCDGKQASFSGEGLTLIADAIARELRDVNAQAIGGMDMGATPIVAAAAMRMNQLGRPMVAFVVRKDVKEHGTKKEIEGPLPKEPSRIVIIDDVVTSGGSIIKSIEAVRKRGHEVVLALSVLDRDAGGGEALRALGVKYQPLVTIAELGISNE
jgi:orotate phosphoribosyltransferase